MSRIPAGSRPEACHMTSVRNDYQSTTFTTAVGPSLVSGVCMRGTPTNNVCVCVTRQISTKHARAQERATRLTGVGFGMLRCSDDAPLGRIRFQRLPTAAFKPGPPPQRPPTPHPPPPSFPAAFRRSRDRSREKVSPSRPKALTSQILPGRVADPPKLTQQT